MQIENVSGFPGNRCSVTYYEDDEPINETFTEYLSDEEALCRELSNPEINDGGRFLKVEFKTPDGVTVETSLPFRHEPDARFYDDFHFCNYSWVDLRKVGKIADFTLLYATLDIDDCRNLKITLDGKPADL